MTNQGATEQLFSIIVPCFNCEATLARCVDSILAQTCSSWELILIDDGSQDHTPELCDRFAEADDRIKVIHQENAGVSSARNRGIVMAGGAYLVFADADDQLDPSLLKYAEEALAGGRRDLVYWELSRCFGTGKKDKRFSRSTLEAADWGDKRELLSQLFRDGLFGFACNKAVRRSIVAENGLLFDEKRRVFEDQRFFMDLWPYLREIALIPKPLYRYYISPESAIQRLHTEEEADKLFRAYDRNLTDSIRFLEAQGVSAEEIGRYQARYGSGLFSVLFRTFLEAKDEEQARALLRSSKVLQAFHQHIGDDHPVTVKGSIIRWLMSGSWQKKLKVCRALGRMVYCR